TEWVVHRIETESIIVDGNHEQQCLKCEHELEQQQNHDQHSETIICSVCNGSSQRHHTNESDSCDRRMKQEWIRNGENDVENCFHADILRKIQPNDKQKQVPFSMGLASEHE
ncbi:unnamed protein product, partial [Rotaria sp. Silwood1]